MKQIRQQKLKGHNFSTIGTFFNQFYKECLPFELTNAKTCSKKEIHRDCGGQHQMNRLLQGDVGSGKTLVALMSILMAIDNELSSLLNDNNRNTSQSAFRNNQRVFERYSIKSRHFDRFKKSI